MPSLLLSELGGLYLEQLRALLELLICRNGANEVDVDSEPKTSEAISRQE